jgi:peptide/nickel transport system permease protein
LALLLGVTTTLLRNSVYDKIINSIALISISIPEYLVAYIVILVFAVFWPVLPSIAIVNSDMDLGERIYRCALPALTLTVVITANMMRMTRALLIGVLANSYIEMAHLKGLSKTEVILRHALPNAWGPIATVISFNLAYLIVGIVIVEVVFAYPGIGQLMVDAVRYRDMPVIQGCALIFAATYIIVNLIADLIGIATNPRLLHPR